MGLCCLALPPGTHIMWHKMPEKDKNYHESHKAYPFYFPHGQQAGWPVSAFVTTHRMDRREAAAQVHWVIALLGAHSSACQKTQGMFLQVDLAARLCARPRALSALLRKGEFIPCSPVDTYCIISVTG